MTTLFYLWFCTTGPNVVTPDEIYIRENKSIELKCTVSHVKQWLLNNKVLPEDIQIASRSIFIPYIKQHHQGGYTCEGFNIPFKYLAGYAKLTIICKFQFILVFFNYMLPLIISCNWVIMRKYFKFWVIMKKTFFISGYFRDVYLL